jgi:leucyl-tRNA synthetase
MNESEMKIIHQTNFKVSKDIENLEFNTAISQLMICHNQLTDQADISKEAAQIFTILLSPFAPHIAEEIGEQLGMKPSISSHPWPAMDEKYLIESTVAFAIQVNGKLRATVEAAPDSSKDFIRKLAIESPKVAAHLKGEIVKEIFVPKKLYNFVVKGDAS